MRRTSPSSCRPRAKKYKRASSVQADTSLPMQRNEHVKHAQRAAQLLANLREQGVIAHSVHSDSRQLTPGALFLAYPGERDDGRRHLSEAVRAGAAAVLWEAHSFDWSQTPAVVQGLPNIGVKDLRQLAGPVAAGLYERRATQAGIEVDRAPDVIAVTGTNGKTSCAVWIAQALALAGRCCGLVGTLGIEEALFRLVTARALSFPESTNCLVDATLPKKMGTCPAMTSLRAGPPPL